MYDCHSKLNKYYEDCVRLKNVIQDLKTKRDLNLDRVKEGLKENSLSSFTENCPQGSMAMHITNQPRNGDDYDIDHALIFDSKAIPSDNPLEIKKIIANALKEIAGDKFKYPPEVRTNAVTIWYESGYHIDFAIYKKESDNYFHAGKEWTPRNPKAITEWFDECNKSKSPKNGKVSDNQLKRIVRLIKFWSRGDFNKTLPGGLILTILAEESYYPSSERDDLSLFITLHNMKKRLSSNLSVQNPCDKSIQLIKEEDKESMIELRDFLNESLSYLDTLLTTTNLAEAETAWGNFFRDTWFNPNVKNYLQKFPQQTPVVEVNYEYRNRIKTYNHNSNTLGIPRHSSISFTIKNPVPGFKYRWEVRNAGTMAKKANQLTPRAGQLKNNNPFVCLETAAFKGIHKMICFVNDGTKEMPHEIFVKIM